MSDKTKPPEGEEVPTLKLDEILRRDLKEFFGKAQRAGFTRIDVGFAGGGDEGYLSGVERVEPVGLSDAPLDDEPEELADRVLEAHGGDYSNGDGGQGEVQFHIDTNTVHVEFSENYTKTRDASQAAKL